LPLRHLVVGNAWGIAPDPRPRGRRVPGCPQHRPTAAKLPSPNPHGVHRTAARQRRRTGWLERSTSRASTHPRATTHATAMASTSHLPHTRRSRRNDVPASSQDALDIGPWSHKPVPGNEAVWLGVPGVLLAAERTRHPPNGRRIIPVDRCPSKHAQFNSRLVEANWEAARPPAMVDGLPPRTPRALVTNGCPTCAGSPSLQSAPRATAGGPCPQRHGIRHQPRSPARAASGPRTAGRTSHPLVVVAHDVGDARPEA